MWFCICVHGSVQERKYTKPLTPKIAREKNALTLTFNVITVGNGYSA